MTGVEVTNLHPQVAAALSKGRTYFAAMCNFAQEALAAAHDSPTDRQKVIEDEAHTQESS